MRLIKYVVGGQTGVGAAVGDQILATPWPDFDSLFAQPDPLVAVRSLDLTGAPAVQPDRLLAPTVRHPLVIGTGGNYQAHAKEAQEILTLGEPIFFAKLWSAVIGPDDEIQIPTEDTLTDYEVELSIVINSQARGLTEKTAMNHVFGYTIVNDVSARDAMIREAFQIMLSKSADTFCPVGPAVVTADDIPDPHILQIGTTLNGEPRQSANTKEMVARIPQVLAALTRTVTLHPGDIVTTGTPAGVGMFRQPPEYMQPGDVIVAHVEGIGELRNRVVAGW